MPIYMDRHNMPHEITSEDIAHMHQADLKIEHKFNCKGLTYWCDEERKTAFCLIEAPDAQSVHDMHNQAHGQVPHTVIEVDSAIVESFLGRISDPIKAQKTELNIINEPAFRTIMVTEIKKVSLKNTMSKQLNLVIKNNNKSIVETINKFKGRIVKQKIDYFLTSFDSVTNAVLCATEIQNIIDYTHLDLVLNIGLSAGVPVTDKKDIFGDTIKIAEWLCESVKGNIAISSEVKDLFESENLNISINKTVINTLNNSDEKFLNVLISFIDKEWNNVALKIDDFSKHLGYSKSQLYRKMMNLTGKSPIAFLQDYRLNKALKLLDNNSDNISEIAYKTGFNTPGYFSKRFFEKYAVLPSNYLK